MFFICSYAGELRKSAYRVGGPPDEGSIFDIVDHDQAEPPARDAGMHQRMRA
jgi:hypothetical protein